MAFIEKILIIKFLVTFLILPSYTQPSWRKFRRLQYESKPDEFPEETAKCLNEGEKFVSEQDCQVYFKCKTFGSVMRAVPKFCPKNTVFDNQIKKCIKLFGNCPNVPSDFPYIDLCEGPNKMYAFPNNCSSYFRCYLHTNGIYYPEKMQCPKGHNFSEIRQECVDGECPQKRNILPFETGWRCNKLGDYNVHPTNCSEFYKCVYCDDEKSDWCYIEHRCRNGTFFDKMAQTCVEGYCPQDLVELPVGPGWSCEINGQLKVDPLDCRDYYECMECNLPSGWCYEPKNCPPGQSFDESLEICINVEACPLPPDWECDQLGEKYAYPYKCKQYYTCNSCSAPGGLCYEVETCKKGEVFDDRAKECVKSKNCIEGEVTTKTRSLSQWLRRKAYSYYNYNYNYNWWG